MAVQTQGAAEEERSSPQHSCFQRIKQFNCFDICPLIIGLIPRLVDVGSDLWLAVTCFKDGNYWWGGLTLLFAIVPTYIVQVFSLYELVKERNVNTVTCWLMHITGLGVEYRYMLALKTSLTGKSEQLEKKTRSLIYLNVVNNFESAPQLLLQFYITIKLEDITLSRGLAMLSSLLAIAWSFGVSERIGPDGRLLPWGEVWVEVFVVTLWLTASLTARLVAFTALALTSTTAFWIFIGVHWLAMTAWEHHYDPDDVLGGDTGCLRLCGSAVTGLLFSVHYDVPGKSPVEYWTRYTIFLLEHLGCVSAYVMWRDHPTTEPAWNQIALILARIVGLASGLDLLLAIVYLYFFVPNGRESLPCLAACASSQEDVNSVPSLPSHGGRHSESLGENEENSSPLLPQSTALTSGDEPQVDISQPSSEIESSPQSVVLGASGAVYKTESSGENTK